MCVCMPWGRGTTILFTDKPRVVVSVNTHTTLFFSITSQNLLYWSREVGGREKH